MGDVFISYAHQDGIEAKRLVDALRATNVSGWLDKADIASGESISSAVREALTRSSAVVAVLSPQAVQSHYVLFELGAAWAQGKKIIPVIVSGKDFEGDLPDILRNHHIIDARNRPSADVVRDIERALKAA